MTIPNDIEAEEYNVWRDAMANYTRNLPIDENYNNYKFMNEQRRLNQEKLAKKYSYMPRRSNYIPSTATVSEKKKDTVISFCPEKVSVLGRIFKKYYIDYTIDIDKMKDFEIKSKLPSELEEVYTDDVIESYKINGSVARIYLKKSCLDRIKLKQRNIIIKVRYE